MNGFVSHSARIRGDFCVVAILGPGALKLLVVSAALEWLRRLTITLAAFLRRVE